MVCEEGYTEGHTPALPYRTKGEHKVNIVEQKRTKGEHARFFNR